MTSCSTLSFLPHDVCDSVNPLSTGCFARRSNGSLDTKITSVFLTSLWVRFGSGSHLNIFFTLTF